MRPLTNAALLVIAALTLTACHSHPCPVCESEDVYMPYRHVVAFKFKQTTTDQQIEQIIEDFAGLQDDIDTIIGFEHGKQVSPEPFAQGYTHVFTVTFKDQAGLETYLPHPAHKAFVEKLLPLLDPPPFVVDYVAE